MSQSWKCILCGETIISKCPGQRSTFQSDHMAGVLGMLTTFNLVRNVRNSGSELFISYSTDSDSASQAFADLVELMKDHMDYPSRNHCNHIYVINSHTKTTCTLDHEHPNLNDVDRLLAEYGDNVRKPQIVPTMIRQYAAVTEIPIEMARKNVNCCKTVFDPAVENDFYHIKRNVRDDLEKVISGQSVQPQYRARIKRKYPEYDRFAYFEERDDAVAFIRGRALNGQLTELEILDEKHERYEDEKLDVLHYCTICKQPAVPESTIVVITEEGTMHLECLNKRTRDRKVRRHTSSFVVKGNKENRRSQEELCTRLGMDSIDCHFIEERNHTRVYLVATADQATYEGMVKAVRQALV